MSRRPAVLLLIAAVLIGGTPVVTGETWSAFTGQTENAGSSLAAQRIFSGTRTTSAWDVRDAATGTETNDSDAVSIAGDGRVAGTNALPTTYDPAKYIEFAMEKSLPGGLAVSDGTVLLDLSRAGSAGTLSFFVELRRVSTGTVLQTFGSPAAPLGTLTTSTPQPFSVTAAALDSTTLANDVAVRIYGWDTANAQLGIDRVQVDGSTPHTTFTLLRWSAVEAFGTPTTFPYRLTAAGDSRFVTSGDWATAFASTRYLELTFDPDLPPGATVTGVSLTHSFRSVFAGGGPDQCVYYEARSGATVIGSSFGGISQAAPSCTSTSYRTDTLELTGVDTAGEVNGLVVRIYGRNSKSVGSQHDQATLAVTYGLD